MTPPDGSVLPFTAVMLAGGAGRRLGGADKAFLAVGGTALAERVRDAVVAAGAGELLAVGGDAERLRAAGWNPVPDRWPGEGPLGGVVTGLEAARHDLVLVVACDLPALDPSALAAVVRALAGDPSADAAVPVSGGPDPVLEVLHAAYRAAAARPLAAAFAAGVRSLRDALAPLRVRTLGLPAPVATRTLADVDTAEDLDRARREAGECDV